MVKAANNGANNGAGMIGPYLGPHVEEIYRLHQEGVSTRQMADVARLFMDQVGAKASASAMQRGGKIETHIHSAIAAQLVDWERNAEREAKRHENASEQIAELAARAAEAAGKRGIPAPLPELVAQVVDGSGTGATIVGHIVAHAQDADVLLSWMLENKHKGWTLWMTYAFEFNRDIEAMIGWIRSRVAAQNADCDERASEGKVA